MKKYIYLLACLVLFSACDNNENSPNKDSNLNSENSHDASDVDWQTELAAADEEILNLETKVAELQAVLDSINDSHLELEQQLDTYESLLGYEHIESLSSDLNFYISSSIKDLYRFPKDSAPILSDYTGETRVMAIVYDTRSMVLWYLVEVYSDTTYLGWTNSITRYSDDSLPFIGIFSLSDDYENIIHAYGQNYSTQQTNFVEITWPYGLGMSYDSETGEIDTLYQTNNCTTNSFNIRIGDSESDVKLKLESNYQHYANDVWGVYPNRYVINEDLTLSVDYSNAKLSVIILSKSVGI